MRRVQGFWQDGERSHETAGELCVSDAGFFAPGERPVPRADLKFSARLHGLPDVIRFPDGRRFCTRDHDGLDAALHATGHAQKHWALWLEQRWRIAVLALFMVGGGLLAAVIWGLPYAAREVAMALPQSVQNHLGVGVLRTLDQGLLDASTLPEETRTRLTERFDSLAQTLGMSEGLQLHFRRGIGPNALAIPDGSIVLTDELVLLAKNDDELMAVLAHELGHAHHRHSLRLLLQTGGVAVIVSGLFGDLGGLSALAASAPTLLINAQYSRDLESEADTFSAQTLHRLGLPASAFTEILTRMSEAVHDDQETGLDFLRSHPVTPERVRAFELRYREAGR